MKVEVTENDSEGKRGKYEPEIGGGLEKEAWSDHKDLIGMTMWHQLDTLFLLPLW